MRILITGGSGYLGRALTKAWHKDHVVCIYSRSESAQAALEPYANVRKFIGDVRDLERLRRAMGGCEVVIHAAALKRIEVGQYNPGEMVKTNVIGTSNVIEAAQDAGVRRVVFVSSDKAWQPISPYGQSKALAESLVLAANHQVGERGPSFCVVRYGNVMGSTGSVVPRWRAPGQWRITDPDATRFWMSVGEAVDVVTNAMHGYMPLLVPKHLPAFRLGDLAEAMGIWGKCEVTGLPPWEKLHEGMAEDCTSDKAQRMSVDEIRQRLKEVE